MFGRDGGLKDCDHYRSIKEQFPNRFNSGKVSSFDTEIIIGQSKWIQVSKQHQFLRAGEVSPYLSNFKMVNVVLRWYLPIWDNNYPFEIDFYSEILNQCPFPTGRQPEDLESSRWRKPRARLVTSLEHRLKNLYTPVFFALCILWIRPQYWQLMVKYYFFTKVRVLSKVHSTEMKLFHPNGNPTII